MNKASSNDVKTEKSSYSKQAPKPHPENENNHFENALEEALQNLLRVPTKEKIKVFLSVAAVYVFVPHTKGPLMLIALYLLTKKIISIASKESTANENPPITAFDSPAIAPAIIKDEELSK